MHRVALQPMEDAAWTQVALVRKYTLWKPNSIHASQSPFIDILAATPLDFQKQMRAAHIV